MTFVVKLSFLVAVVCCICYVRSEVVEDRKCDKDQYYHTVFGKCEQCSGICKPLSRKDCQRKCKDYVRKQLAGCTVEQYYSYLYHKCLPCIAVCQPVTTFTCQTECQGFLTRTTTTQTRTTEVPTTYKTKPNVGWANTDDYIIISVVSVCGLVILACGIAALWCFKDDIRKRCNFGKPCKKVKQDIEAVQETTPMTVRRNGPGEESEEGSLVAEEEGAETSVSLASEGGRESL